MGILVMSIDSMIARCGVERCGIARFALLL